MRFLDPIYGLIRPTPEEYALLLAPEVQRLRYIRMCNINSLFLASASEISRFEHIIGVLHLAKIWSKANSSSESQEYTLNAAAILHDVQTGPYGHSLEYILDDNQVDGGFEHENLLGDENREFYQEIDAARSFSGSQFRAKKILSSSWKEVAATINGEGELGPVISANLDIDNIDNVLRLSYHMGLVEKVRAKNIAEKLVSDLRIENGIQTISSTGGLLIQDWQSIREEMYQILLYDEGDFAAKAMLTKVLEDAVSLELMGSDSWVLTDDGLIDHLLNKLTGSGQAAKEILMQFVRGDFYHTVALLKVNGNHAYDELSKSNTKRNIEKTISKILSCRSIFHVIKDKNKTKRQIEIFNRDLNEETILGSSSDELLIGLFSSQPNISELAKETSLEYIHKILAEHGVSADVHTITDPLATYSNEDAYNSEQMELFSCGPV